MRLFLLNIAIMLVWVGLTAPTVYNFTVGLAMGFVLLWMFGSIFDVGKYRTMLTARPYGRHFFLFWVFVVMFIKAFLWSNVAIAIAVLFRPSRSIHPRIVSYDVKDLSDLELLILANCITLTPGTTTIDVSEDRNKLIIHAFDGRDVAAVRSGIDRDLRNPILRFTR